jgi:hypothetical protein
MSGPFGAGGLGFFGTAEFYDYLLKRSLRFNDDGSTGATGTASRLRFEPTTTGSNTDWTVSFWIKRNGLGTTQDIINVGSGDGTGSSGSGDTNADVIQLRAQDDIRIHNDGTTVVHTNALFRDTSAWYNIVVKSDTNTTSGDNKDKLKVYINGVDQDDSDAGGGGFSTDNRSSLSSWAEFGSTDPIQIGARIWNNGNNLDAYLAEFHYVDGTALTASSFGETKEGIWIPKNYTGTHGTNGFYLNFTNESTAAGFSSVAYTGPIPASAASGTTGTVSGVGFQPDLVWIKNRTFSLGSDHQWFDTVRGIDSSGDQALHSNRIYAQSTSNTNGGVSSIDSDGFTVKAGTDTGTGRSRLTGSDADNYVSWNWQAGGTPTATNSAGAGNTPTANSVKIDGSNLGSALAGTIPATKLSANTTYGFSIVTYTGTGANGTVAHGLTSDPKWVIVKNTSTGSLDWRIFHTALTGSAKVMTFTLNGEGDNATTFNSTAPTSTVFSVGTSDNSNKLNDTMVAYCWSEVSGYSKFGSYTGNGSSTGPTITTGFDVGWLMIKKINASGTSWVVLDRARDAATQGTRPLFASENAVEVFSPNVTFTSTGFQIITASTAVNSLDDTFIYMAFKNTRTNAFYLDQSGNGNHLSATGFEYTDSVPDLPTNNFCVVNSLSDVSDIVLSNGNLTLTSTTDSWPTVRGIMSAPSGKWYYEVVTTDQTRWGAGWGTTEFINGSTYSTTTADSLLAYSTDPLSVLDFGTTRSINGSPAFTTSDILQVAIDIDAGKFWLGINNTYVNNSSGSAGNPSAGTNELETFTAGTEMFPAFINNSGNLTINFGQDSTFSNLRTKGGNADANGNGDFFYAPPTGFLALCSDNLPDPAIDPAADENPTDYFANKIYSGNGTTQSITGVGFEPDWVWIKDRDATANHVLVDRVRGVSELLYSNSPVTAVPGASQISSFDSDGFTLGAATYVNETGTNRYISWNWKAGGTAVSNGNGSITSSVSANREAGFSVVGYTGTGSSFTVGHGLSSAPEVVIFKDRDSNVNWIVYHKDYASSQHIQKLNLADEQQDAGGGYALTRGSSTLGILTGAGINKDGSDHIAYCLHSVEGYSKFGSYTGNNSSDGPFVYTGFRPAWLLIKRTDVSSDWVLVDTARDPFNDFANFLYPNLDNSEDTDAATEYYDALSNGFKLRYNWTAINALNGAYIYMAFAEQPFKYANAR